MAKRTSKKRTSKRAPTRKKAPARSSTGRGGSFRILSLDGGGIRGVMTAHWLAALEDRLGGPVSKHVDLIAGTSTGSILGSALCIGVPAAEIVDLYRDRGREIFPATVERLWDRARRSIFELQGPSAPKYSDEGLEDTLRAQFGEITMGDLPERPGLMVTAYNTQTRRPEMFKSWRAKHAHVPLWEAAKASSSAPTYFPAHVTGVLGGRAPLVDGGVVANNPTACAIAEAVRLNLEGGGVPLDRFVVGSFGTGENDRPITLEAAREWGALEWAVPIISVLMDGAGEAVNYIAAKLLPEDRYVRLDRRLERGFDDMDDASRTNIDALLNLAEDYLRKEDGGERIEKLATLLEAGGG